MEPKYNKSEKKFNLRSSKELLKVEAGEIPNTISAKAVAEWIGDDPDPFYKIQQIDYPIKANGDIYLESFFQSFINSLPDAPIPGAKDGHNKSWGARANTDFIMAGAKLVSNGDSTGSVFFKNYIPKENNETFIKELNSNMVEFSLVAYVKEERVDDGRGNIEWHVTEALRGFRNDAVDVGSMEQKLNSRNTENNNNQGEEMNKKLEHLDGLLGFKTNGEVTLLEIAKHLGLESQVITDDVKQKVNSYDSVVKLCGEKPIEFITGLVEEKKENADKVREAKFNELFGPKVHETTKKENTYRTYAETFIGDSELTDEKINSFKENSIAVKLAAEYASIDSNENLFGEDVDGKKENKVVKTTETVEY